MKSNHCVGILLICMILKKANGSSKHLNFWGKFCRSLTYIPEKKTDKFNLAQCAGYCMEHLGSCRVISYDGKICAIYGLFSPRVFSICTAGLGAEEQSTFFIRYEMNEVITPMINVALFKPVANSSTSGYTGHPTPCFDNPKDETVVDGIVRYDIDIFQGIHCETWAHYYQSKPWLRVDLLLAYAIEEVILYNAGNGHESLLHDIEIRVGMLDIANNPIMEHQPPILQDALCASVMKKKIPEGPNVFRCQSAPLGRFVTVHIKRRCKVVRCKFSFNRIALIELEVWVYPQAEKNLAFLKPVIGAKQDLNASWNYATDGYKSLSTNEIGRPIAFISEKGSPNNLPWLQINLLDIFVVRKVTLYNVDEEIPGYLHDIEVRIGMNATQVSHTITKKIWKNELCSSILDVAFPSGKIDITCFKKLSGTYVTVQIVKMCETNTCSKTPNRLILSEVEVFGDISYAHDSPNNLAVKKPTSQSSTVGAARAELAVDENTRSAFYLKSQPQCTMTNDVDKYPWWKVDLVEEHLVSSVNIFSNYNNNTQLHDLFIEVGNLDIAVTSPNSVFRKNSLCAQVWNQTLANGKSKFRCQSTSRGNFISIQITRFCSEHDCFNRHKNILSLCEVQIMGATIPKYERKLINLAYESMFIAQSTQKNNISGPTLTVDGFTNYGLTACSSTSEKHGEDQFPWWRGEAVEDILVKRVVLFNHYGEHHKRLHDIQIRVGYEDIANLPLNIVLYKNSICAYLVNYALAGEVDLECSQPLAGRFVSIQIVDFCTHESCTEPNLNILALCEVQIWGYPVVQHMVDELKNEAMFRPTVQSSTFAGATSNLAVDGITSSALWNGAQYMCTQTNAAFDESFPWWRVDMLNPAVVHHVEIFNIGQTLHSKLHDFSIRVGNVDIASFPFGSLFLQNEICTQVYNQTFPAGLLRLSCQKPVSGRYLSIQIVRQCTNASCTGNDANVLYLCEVFVWASKTSKTSTGKFRNIARDKLTQQSSTTAFSHLAVDGIKKIPKNDLELLSSCSSTKKEMYPWWTVKLETAHIVHKVGIFYREAGHLDPQHHLEIRIGNTNIADAPLGRHFISNPVCTMFEDDYIPKALNELNCDAPLVGYYVSVQLLPTCGIYKCSSGLASLHLCEIEIYGEILHKL